MQFWETFVFLSLCEVEVTDNLKAHAIIYKFIDEKY